MKKIVSIFFVTLFLFSTTELAELFRIPALLVHFVEHKEESPDISLIDFLELHYNLQLADHHHEKGSDDHKNLPFNGPHVSMTVFVSTHSFVLKLKNIQEDENKLKTQPSDDQFSENTYLSSIWEPPKFC